MRATVLALPGPILIEPSKHGDERGWFCETFKADWFKENVADVNFVQDNQSFSSNTGTIRGLHYQKPPFGQGKLVRVIVGALYDVAVDIRPYSPNFGKWIGIELSAENSKQLWIPDGFLHGFCTLKPNTEVSYKVTAPYNALCDAGIAFDDPEIGIKWPIDIATATISDKDKSQARLDSLRN